MSSAPSTAVVVVTAGAAVAAGVILWSALTRKPPARDFPKLPGSLPVIGNMAMLSRNMPEVIDQARNKLGNAFWVQTFGMTMLLLLGGENNKWALLKGDGKYITFGWPERWKALLGPSSLTFKDKAEHRQMRTLLSKGLARSVISFFYPSLVKNSAKIIGELAIASEQGTKDIQPLATAKIFTYEAICSFLACGDPQHEEALKSLREDFLIWSNGLGDLIVPAWMSYISPFAKAMAARGRILEALAKIVADRRARMEHGEIFQDSIGILLEAKDEEGNMLSDVDIGDSFITLAFAGFDTTAGSISSVFHILMNEISEEDLELLRAEISGLPESVDESTLTSLPVLDAFVKETLRLYAPVPGVFKRAREDIVMDDGRAIKGGTMLQVNFIANHQNPEIYPDPKQFKLSRFLLDEVDKKFPMEYTPFSVGARMCLGFQLAKLEMKVFILELFRGFELTQGSKPTEFHIFPMRIANPHLRLRRKDNAC
ncbi:hypothetical protein HDU67_003137 [Dinochytrium kinnereticum]|nr:hypothetical protein HDU67_003137 [Dinochytrium kinnereticum]